MTDFKKILDQAKEIDINKNIFEKNKQSILYKKVLENFPDAEMTEVKIKKGEKNE